MEDVEGLPGSRPRSDSMASTASHSTSGRLLLRQRVVQLLTCVEDLSSDEEIQEEVSRTLNEAFLVCGKRSARDAECFRLHMVTWNVGTAAPPATVSSLLEIDREKPIDLYVIGLQEVNSKILNFINDMTFEDPWSNLLMDTLSPLGYVKLISIRMQGLLLIVFAKQVHIPFIRDIQASYLRTGIYGYWGNKGGVSVRMSFYGHMICFLNCHLTAHMGNANQRVDEIEHILDTQEFNTSHCPKILDHKVVFWFGDLNFRIADHGMHFMREAINNKRFHLLWEKDQLIMAKKKEAFLREFEEGPLKFKPTYKFDLHSETYDTSGKKRKPAWTDRILWRLKMDTQTAAGEAETEKEEGAQGEGEELEEDEERTLVPEPESSVKLRLESYTTHMSYGISDHKPVTGSFSLEMKKLYNIPLVRLKAEGEWSADQDALITYSILDTFVSSTWDWIGLYKSGFRSYTNYITYVWVKDDEVSVNDEEVQVFLNMDEIPVLGGEFVLCYYSSNLQCIIGVSPPFQIQESKAAIEEGMASENLNGLDNTTILGPNQDF
ncbi:inositol polyphosphate 5-phosphatase K isoform X2 [Amia ocellicauda]|uniref:inositol polyphosphate 5-phosphatase K isoform X2 n=1 Tax=Amia ocellicauda TaxID=2972642 RepID=UPI003463EDAA